MNDTLRRALFTAHLTEEDVAAHLEVDPKTVRRWLTGRLPYARHRQTLAHLLNVEESILWPRLNHVRHLDSELVAVYPHDLEPSAWMAFFNSARSEIDILHQHDPGLADPDLAQLIKRPPAHLALRLILTGTTIATFGVWRRRYIRPAATDFPHDLYRADNELILRQRTGEGSQSLGPLVRLVNMSQPDGLFATYSTAFEAAWQA